LESCLHSPADFSMNQLLPPRAEEPELQFDVALCKYPTMSIDDYACSGIVGTRNMKARDLTPAAIRVLYLPGIKEMIFRPEMLPLVYKFPDEMSRTTVFRSMVQFAWMTEGLLFAIHVGLFHILDTCVYLGFSLLIAEAANQEEQTGTKVPPQDLSNWSWIVPEMGYMLVVQAILPLLSTIGFYIRRLTKNPAEPDAGADVTCETLADRFDGHKSTHQAALLKGSVTNIFSLKILSEVVLRRVFYEGSCRHLCWTEVPVALIRVFGSFQVSIGNWSSLWLAPIWGLRCVQWELRQLKFMGLQAYLQTPGKFLEVVMSSTSVIVTGLIMNGKIGVKEATTWLALVALLFGFKMIILLRSLRNFGHLVRIVFSSGKAMAPFLVILLLMLLTFCASWLILATAHPSSHFTPEEDRELCTAVAADGTTECATAPQNFSHMIWRALASFMVLYRMSVLEDIDGSVFALRDYSGFADDTPGLATALPAWVIFICATIVLGVLLMNLLIAVISDAYEDLASKASIEMERERASVCIISSFMDLIGPFRQRYPYMFVSFPSEKSNDKLNLRGGLSQEEAGDGKILEMRKTMRSMDQELHRHIKSVEQFVSTAAAPVEEVDANVEQLERKLDIGFGALQQVNKIQGAVAALGRGAKGENSDTVRRIEETEKGVKKVLEMQQQILQRLDGLSK